MTDVIAVSWAPDEAERLGKWLLAQRESRGWRRPKLAERMGYRNLNRGCSRIADWEAGRDVPRGDRVAVLQQALEVDSEPMEGLLAAFHAAGRRARSAHRKEEGRRYRVGQGELRLLGEHRELLLHHAETILANPAWSNVRMSSAVVHVSWFGGATLTLGGILKAWLNGTAVLERDDGRLYVVYISGSPLSGSNRVLAVDTEGKLVSTKDRTFLPMAGPLLKCAQSRADDASAWSLSQVLSALGAEIQDIHFWGPDGTEVWRYNHASMTIHGPQGAADLSLLFESETGQIQWRANWDESKMGGKITIGQLSPLRQGIWRGDEVSWSDSQGCEWHAPKGCLLRRNGALEFTLDAIAPPAVLSWMVEQP